MTDGNGVGNHPQMIRMEEQLKGVKADILDLKTLVRDESRSIQAELERYVRTEVFEPVRILVYGLVGLVLSGVVTGVIALVVRSGG